MCIYSIWIISRVWHDKGVVLYTLQCHFSSRIWALWHPIRGISLPMWSCEWSDQVGIVLPQNDYERFTIRQIRVYVWIYNIYVYRCLVPEILGGRIISTSQNSDVMYLLYDLLWFIGKLLAHVFSGSLFWFSYWIVVRFLFIFSYYIIYRKAKVKIHKIPI